MSQLEAYFEAARGADPRERRVGIEVETLFIDADGSRPLMAAQAEAFFGRLQARGWKQQQDPKDAGRALHRGGFVIKPEVGAGNVELISPPRLVGEFESLLDDIRARLEMLYGVASEAGARPVFGPYDGFGEVDNIVLQNERDRKWVMADGRAALSRLGHIASVHLTVDLRSIEEGFACIRELNALGRQRNWPPKSVMQTWASYLEDSHRTYHPRRFGEAPESFDEYIALLERFQVVVDRAPDGQLLYHETPVTLADYDGVVDVPSFLGSVWFHTRLRRLGGQLALEVRFVPRGHDDGLAADLRDVMGCLEQTGSRV